MSSYLFLVFILLFGGSILAAATLDFLGLGPTNAMSLGVMMNNATVGRRAAARDVVVVRPARPRDHARSSAGCTSRTSGLDEVFNPRLRRT